MTGKLRVLYVFTARKRRLLERAARGEDPDTLLFGLNHLRDLGIGASFYEPEYGAAGQALSRQIGRLGPDVLQLRTLPQFPRYPVVFLTGGWPLLLAAQAIPHQRRPFIIWLNMTLTNVLRRRHPLSAALRLAVRCADQIVCVARHQQRFLHEQLGLPMERLPLLLSGTDAAFYSRAAAAPGASNTLPPAAQTPETGPAANYILAAGRDAGRDYATLLTAADGLQLNVRLVCSPRNIAGLAVPANATVRFDISPTELRTEYAGASTVAIPTAGDGSTAGSDCSGTLVLLDALAMKKPAVITDRASVHDYVSAGTHTLTVPSGDAGAWRATLTELATSPERAAALAEAGHELVQQRYTTQHFAAGLANLFREAAE